MRKASALVWLLVGVGALASCGAPAMQHQIQSSFPMTQDFDRTWSAVIETFADLNLPISNMEKASGLIVTDWIDYGRDTSTMDCGKIGFPFIEVGRRGKFNVFVKSDGNGGTVMRVSSSFEITSSYENNVQRGVCYSTGALENRIRELVAGKLAVASK